MTSERSIELTDAMIERMIVDRGGPRAPAGLVASIVADAGSTPQRRAFGLPTIRGSRRALAWSLIAIAVALLAVAAVIAGSSSRPTDAPIGGSLLIAKLEMAVPDAGSPSTVSVFELDPVTGAQSPLVVFPITSTNGFGGSEQPVWAPDRQHALLFDDNGMMVGILDMATRVVTPLRHDDAANGADQTTWSPAGDRFAWLLPAREGSRVIITDVLGVQVGELALPATLESDLGQPRWSPDGSTILMIAGCLPCPPGPKVLAVPLDGSPIRELLDEAAGNVGLAEWSPDGSAFAFQTARGITLVDLADGRQSVVNNGFGRGVSWSPDGHHIAFARLDGDAAPTGIFIAAADGSDLRSITDGPDDDPRWSPDGRWLVFSRNEWKYGPSVWVVSVDGGAPRRLVGDARADW